MNQTNNRIRDEWVRKLRDKWETFSVVNDYYENADIRLNSDKIADFFIPEIDELLKSQRDEERLRSAKIVEELMEDSEHWQPIASRIMDRVIIGKEDLSLIKNN